MKQSTREAIEAADRAAKKLRQTSTSGKKLTRKFNTGRVTEFQWDVRKLCELAGFNPIPIMIDVIMTGRLPDIPIPNPNPQNGEGATVMKSCIVSDEERLKTLREITKYVVPTLSAVQVTGKDGGAILTANLDVVALMADPALAAAAQTLSLAVTNQNQEQRALGSAPGDDEEILEGETE